MQSYPITSILIIILMLLQRTGISQETAKKCDPNEEIKILAAYNNEFAFDLYSRLSSHPTVKGKNLFFSPYSISTAMAMTYAGTRGETAEQMADVLRFEFPQEKLHAVFGKLQSKVGAEKNCQLNIANALWGQKGYKFLDEFLTVVNNNYGGGLRQVDFINETEKTRQIINTWVEEQTKKKIKELIQQGVLGTNTRLVLTNAIYFKGNWSIQFDENKTKDADFFIIADKKVKAPMMHQKADFKYWADENVQVLELPYVGEDLSMVVFLPKTAEGLIALEKQITQENIGSWMDKLRKKEVTVYLPRFKFTWGVFDLTDTLTDMGMKDAFRAGKADFSGMTGNRDLLISFVLHKAFVEVNEEGTEAAAATAVGMRLTAALEPTIFRADHPFVFIIKDNRTNSILFLGRVMKPTEDSI